MRRSLKRAETNLLIAYLYAVDWGGMPRTLLSLIPDLLPPTTWLAQQSTPGGLAQRRTASSATCVLSLMPKRSKGGTRLGQCNFLNTEPLAVKSLRLTVTFITGKATRPRGMLVDHSPL